MANTVTLVKLENPFDPSSREFEALEWDKEKSVGDYISPLGWDHYAITTNGEQVTEEDVNLVFPKEGDMIAICKIPAGGDDGNSFLRIVAFAALTAVSAGVGGAAVFGSGAGGAILGGVAQAGVMIAGSMIINAALPPPIDKKEELDDGPSYGLDGAKNTAREGVSVPICYGKFKSAGNIVQFSTINVDSKNQDVYVLICLGEAPINSVTDITINDQPIENYDGWSYAIKIQEAGIFSPKNWDIIVDSEVGYMPPGSSQARLRAPDLDGAYTAYNRSVTVTDDPFDGNPQYTTTGLVDGIRLDFVTPQGFFFRGNYSGKFFPIKIGIEAQYRKQGETAWQSFPSDLVAANDVSVIYAYDYLISGLFVPIGEFSDWTQAVSNNPQNTAFKGNLTAPQTKFDVVVWNADGKTGQINRVIPAKPAGTASGGHPARPRQVFNNVGTAHRGSFVTSDDIFFTGKSRTPLRFSLKNTNLDEAVYEIRVRRTSPQKSGTTIEAEASDEIVWTDVNEIVTDKIGYEGSAMMLVKIKLSDQLTSVPNITYVCEGMKISNYKGDLETGAWEVSHTSNPAWIAYHMLTSELGARQSANRIDFYAWHDWAQYCDQKKL